MIVHGKAFGLKVTKKNSQEATHRLFKLRELDRKSKAGAKHGYSSVIYDSWLSLKDEKYYNYRISTNTNDYKTLLCLNLEMYILHTRWNIMQTQCRM